MLYQLCFVTVIEPWMDKGTDGGMDERIRDWTDVQACDGGTD